VQAHENEGDRDEAHGVKSYFGTAVEPLIDEWDAFDKYGEGDHESEKEEERLKRERFVPAMACKPESVFEVPLVLDIDIGEAGILYFPEFGGMLGAVTLQLRDFSVVAASGEEKHEHYPDCEAAGGMVTRGGCR
jgi:hypothetical protein